MQSRYPVFVNLVTGSYLVIALGLIGLLAFSGKDQSGALLMVVGLIMMVVHFPWMFIQGVLPTIVFFPVVLLGAIINAFVIYIFMTKVTEAR